LQPWIVHLFTRFLLFFSLVTYLVTPIAAQIVQGGQVFTNGLAIVDSPQPNTQLSAGQSIGLAIDVSGDGSIPASAQVPGSGQATSFECLSVFLTSYVLGVNYTISAGVLEQEPGSTVKHVNTLIPVCIPAGPYNLTLYETSSFQGNSFFTITYIPVHVNNAIPYGLCLPQINLVLPYPQPSNPLPANPFLQPAVPTTPITVQSTTAAPVITTVTASGMTTVYTSATQSSISGEIYITLASGESVLPAPTTPPTSSAITVTVVYVSMETVPTMVNGQSTNDIVEHESTTTRVLHPTGFAGLVPVNASPRTCIPWLTSVACAFMLSQLM